MHIPIGSGSPEVKGNLIGLQAGEQTAHAEATAYDCACLLAILAVVLFIPSCRQGLSGLCTYRQAGLPWSRQWLLAALQLACNFHNRCSAPVPCISSPTSTASCTSAVDIRWQRSLLDQLMTGQAKSLLSAHNHQESKTGLQHLGAHDES